MTSTPHDFGTSIPVGRPRPVTSSAGLPHHGPWSRHAWPCPFFYEGNWRDGCPDGRGVDRCTCGAGFPETALGGVPAVEATKRLIDRIGEAAAGSGDTPGRNTELIAEARANLLAQHSMEPYNVAARALHAQGDLVRRLADALEEASRGGETMFTSEYVDALRAELAPRVVSSVAELDATLPAHTVMRDANGDIFEWTETGVQMTGATGVYIARNWIVLPATVLYAPPVVGSGETGRNTEDET